MKVEMQWFSGADDLTEAYGVRTAVFCDEQGYTKEMEMDEQDKNSLHIVLRKDGKAVATGRLYECGDGAMRIGRLAVLGPLRGKGVGRTALRAMMEKARSLGARRLELDAQCSAIGFYEKEGFSVCGGEHLDGHILHKLMQKEL